MLAKRNWDLLIGRNMIFVSYRILHYEKFCRTILNRFRLKRSDFLSINTEHHYRKPNKIVPQPVWAVGIALEQPLCVATLTFFQLWNFKVDLVCNSLFY